jgi:class 3 adenylate cyclase/CHASE2 domain-containing sensor protein
LSIGKLPSWLAIFLLVSGAWGLARVGFWLLPNVFDTWNAQTIDQVFVLRDQFPRLRPHYDDTIVHVDLDNDSLHKMRTFYVERRQYAQVVRNLAAMGVAVQAYDFIFAARTKPEDDQALIEAIRTAGNAYLGLVLNLGKGSRNARQQPTRNEDQQYVERTAWSLTVQGDPSTLHVGTDPVNTFDDLATASRGLGYLSSTPDRDGVLRRLPLVVRTQGAYYPSLAFRVICDYLHVRPQNIVVTPGRHIVLRGAQRPGAAAPHDIVIPIDRRGAMLVNYLGAWERFTHYPLERIVAASSERIDLEILRDALAGKIVVIADVSTGSSDVGAMPLDATFPLSGLHSNAMHTILTEQFLRELSASEMLLLEALLLGLLLLLALRCRSFTFALGALGLAVGYVAVVVLGFCYGHVIANLVRPLLMLTFATVATLVYRYVTEEKARLEGLRQRDFIRETFGRYLSPDVVEELLDSPHGLQMGGEVRTITLLVSDLRGFTSLAARLTPAEVVAILNRYFERMIEVIARYRGTVDELQGDGMLTFFGAPLAQPDDPERAVACAIAMQLAVRAFNAEQQRLHLPELAMGIGINTGEVIVGNIGSVQRSKYGAVGSAINTAYRIESHTVGGQILLSPSTYEHVRTLVQVRSTLPAQFKGLAQPVTLYEVGGISGAYSLSLPAPPSAPLVALHPPLSMTCFLIDGKIVSDIPVPGALLRLAGAHSAEATIAAQVTTYSNIKLTLAPSDGLPCPDVYAKIMANDTPEAQTACVRLEFTAMPDDAKALLTRIAQTPG